MKKNKFKLLGIIAAVAVIGLSMAGCGDNGGGRGVPEGLIGVWYRAVDSGSLEIRLDSGMSSGVGLFRWDLGLPIEARGNRIYNADLNFRMFNFNLSGDTLTITDCVESFILSRNGTWTRQP